MKDMKVRASFEQEVYIDPAEAFRALKARLGFAPRDGFVGIKNGELVYGEDVSYHGSPMYKYKTISNNPKWLELYRSVECLDDYATQKNRNGRKKSSRRWTKMKIL